MKTKITSIFLAFIFAVSVSPITIAMEKLPNAEDTQAGYLSFPQDVMISILLIAGLPARIAMLTVLQNFSKLIQSLWNDSKFHQFGLWTDRAIFHSLNLGFAMQVPVVDGENIYLVSYRHHNPDKNGFSVIQLDSDAVPNIVPSINLPMYPYLKPIVADSLIFLTEVQHDRGRLKIIQRKKDNQHELIQNLLLDFLPGQHLSRSDCLYVVNGKDDILNVYRRNEMNQYVFSEEIDLGFRWVQGMVLLDERDILLVGQFSVLAVLRLNEDGLHKIVQNIKLPESKFHYSPVVDGEFVYISYECDSSEDFHVMRRDQKGEYLSWEDFKIGNPTSPAIMQNHIIVASQTSGNVSVFSRDNEGHHHLIQNICFEGVIPEYLVPHGSALYISNKPTVFILYQQSDGSLRHIGEFKNPGGQTNYSYSCPPVVNGDVLLFGCWETLTTLSYPKHH